LEKYKKLNHLLLGNCFVFASLETNHDTIYE
jgi:hypothetical protein